MDALAEAWGVRERIVGKTKEARVWQAGGRRLWDEVEAAYRWWIDHGRPEHTRFGLTVNDAGHRAWLDDPADSWAV